MPYYGNDAKEEIRARINIVDVIGECVALKRNGSNYTGLCPFHSEKTPSFSVAPAKGMFHCFGCHEGGDVFKFVEKYYNYTFSEAMEFLAERAGVELKQVTPSGEQNEKRQKREQLIEINTQAARYFHQSLKSQKGRGAYEYFRNRGLSDNTIVRFGLGYASDGYNDLYRHLKQLGYDDGLILESGLVVHYERGGARDKFIDRAMFPIMDMRGKVIGFGGRVMGQGEPKYLNSPDTEVFVKRDNLYAYHLAKNSRSKRVILCEGYMDVISLHQAGFDYAMASLGTALTEGHVSLLKRLTGDVYLCYDSDRAGIGAAARAIGLLGKANIKARVIHMDPYKDPDEFLKAEGADQFEARIEGAENSFLFLMEVKSREYDMSDPTEKTDFYNYLASEIYRVGGKLGWEAYTDAVCRKFGIEKDAMVKAVSELSRTSVAPAPEGAAYEDFVGLEEEAPRQNVRRTAAKPKAEVASQQKLLSWLAEDPSLYAFIKDEISAEDFVGELYRKLSAGLFAQLEGGAVNIPALIEDYEGDEMNEAGACFSTVLEDSYKTDRGKALTELIVNIRQAHLSEMEKALSKSDMALQQQLLNEKLKLQNFKKKGIRI